MKVDRHDIEQLCARLNTHIDILDARHDIAQLSARPEAHVEILDPLPTVQADARLAVAILRAGTAIGFPVTPLTVLEELPAPSYASQHCS
jgi:hypothetical protein